MNITRLAKGQQCQIRLPGICTFNPETTVAAHYSLTGVSGRSHKSPDSCAAWSCEACHSVCDGRASANLTREQIRLAHAEGVIRTLEALDSMGYELKLVDGGRIPKIVRRRA